MAARGIDLLSGRDKKLEASADVAAVRSVVNAFASINSGY